MAKLVTKFKYLKPNRKVSAGGYAKYIATREGVEKIDDTKKFAPATAKQKNLIEKILGELPNNIRRRARRNTKRRGRYIIQNKSFLINKPIFQIW